MYDPYRNNQMNQSVDDSLMNLPFDPAYCDLFMNDFTLDFPFDQTAPGYSLEDHSPHDSITSHSSDPNSPSIASTASSLSTREDHSHLTNTTPSIFDQSNKQLSTNKQSNDSQQRTSRNSKRKAAPTSNNQHEVDKPLKQHRSEDVRLGCPGITSPADENRIIQHFTSSIRNILSLPSTPYTDADCLYIFSHLMDVMRPDLFRRFLTGLNYTSTSSPSAHEADRSVWRSDLRLPMVSLPHRMNMDWSRSLLTPLPDEPNSLNIATLICQRPEAVTLHRFRDGFVAVEAGSSKILNEDHTQHSDPIPLNQVDLSLCSVPISCQVNCAFERLFGYTQQEVRSLFLREGKAALYVLNNRSELIEIHRKNMKGLIEGQTECCWSVGINTKYGSAPLRTLIMMKQFMNETSCTMKKLAMWVPLPKD